MASAIWGSTGPLAKFPRTIFLSIKAGINQKLRKKGCKSGIVGISGKEVDNIKGRTLPVSSPCLVKNGCIAE